MNDERATEGQAHPRHVRQALELGAARARRGKPGPFHVVFDPVSRDYVASDCGATCRCVARRGPTTWQAEVAERREYLERIEGRRRAEAERDRLRAEGFLPPAATSTSASADWESDAQRRRRRLLELAG